MSGYYPTLGFDPAPGDVATVDDLIRTVSRVGDRLGSADTALKQLGHTDGVWQGQAAQAFARRVGDLPKHLSDGETSMAAACRALNTWSSHLVEFQRRAADYERQAADAAAAVSSAKAAAASVTQPGANASQDEKDQAQQQATDAKNKVDATTDELARIINLAKQLLDEHNEMASTAAKTLHDASDVAPAKPGFFTELASALSDAFNFVISLPAKAWNWVKDHADLIAQIGDILSDISTVLALAALVCMFIPPLEAVSGALFLAAAISSGLALGAHSLAKAAGADVSWGTIALDAVGVGTGAVGKVAEIGMAGARETMAAGKLADEGLQATKGLEGMRSGYTELGEAAAVHYAKIWKGATLVGTAGVELGTWNPWFGNLYTDTRKGISALSHVFVSNVGGGESRVNR